MSEEWREVPGFPGTWVTADGLVKTTRRNQNRIRKVTVTAFGYHHLQCMASYGRKRITGVHRLVALAFIPNPNGYPCVHHRDHNKANNSVANLEWVTYSQNIKYNYLTGGQVGKTNMKGRTGATNPASRPVVQLSLVNEEIARFSCVTEAAKAVDGCRSHIVKACRGKLKKSAGYRWRYA